MHTQNPDEIEHVDLTSTLGFENAAHNTVVVWQGDCPKCLLQFNRPEAMSWSVKVYSNHGFDNWCESCATQGIQDGICIKYRSLDKKDRKKLNKYVKQQNRSSQRAE